MRNDAQTRRTCWIAIQIALLGATAALATTYGRPAPAVEEIDHRSLPSLVVVWDWTGQVDQWRLDGGVVYLVGGGLLSAIDSDTGEQLWAYELAQQCSCSKIAVLPGRIAAGIDGRAILVDRASGALVADVALGKSIRSLVAEPLTFAVEGPLEQQFVARFDAVSGVELARYSAPADIRVHGLDGRLVASLEEGNGRAVLVGLDDALREVWRQPLPDGSYLHRAGADLIVESWRPGEATRLSVDPQTGSLLPLPSAGGAGGDFGLDVGIDSLEAGLLQVTRAGKPPRLVMPGGSAGESTWQTDLPVTVGSAAEWRSQFVLLGQNRGGRGVLLMVDRTNGSILRRVAGLRRMSEFEVYGDLLLSKTASGLAAVRLDRFDPPEAASMTVAETVRSILAGLRGDEPALSPYDVRSELEALGEPALPYLVEEIPTGSTEVVEMIAGLMAKHGYGPAAAPLAARAAQALAEPAGDEEAEWQRTSYLMQLAAALAETAGPPQVSILERLLEPGDGQLTGQMPVLAALGRLAPQRALDLIDRLRQRLATDGTWFEPPPAGPWVEIARLEPASGDWSQLPADLTPEEIQRLMLRHNSALAVSTSGQWVVFPSPAYGLFNLWAAPVDGTGNAGEALFLGPHPQLADPEAAGGGALDAHLTGGGLDVGFPGGNRLVVELARLAADRDRDGLTDRLEAHLGLDPESQDSDGDGLIDSHDRAPSGGREPASREERAYLAVHEIQVLLADTALESQKSIDPSTVDLLSAPEHVFLSDAPPLEWSAGKRATFRVPARGTANCEPGGYRVAASPPRPLEPDELAVEQYLRCPPEYGEHSFIFVLRETRRGWVLSGIGE